MSAVVPMRRVDGRCDCGAASSFASVASGRRAGWRSTASSGDLNICPACVEASQRHPFAAYDEVTLSCRTCPAKITITPETLQTAIGWTFDARDFKGACPQCDAALKAASQSHPPGETGVSGGAA